MSNNTYNIRKLCINDYDQYYPLINEFRKTEFTNDQFIEFLNNIPNNINIWVILDNNIIIGTATLIYEPKLIFNITKLAHIEDVCILPTYRNNKVGSILIKYLIKIAKADNCYKITLTCSEKVSKFYLSNEFEKRGIQCSILLKDDI